MNPCWSVLHIIQFQKKSQWKSGLWNFPHGSHFHELFPPKSVLWNTQCHKTALEITLLYIAPTGACFMGAVFAKVGSQHGETVPWKPVS